jgi:hypothetical protein
MAADIKNADLIRAVLDGGQLQFKQGSGWIDCGGDAGAWLVLLVMSATRDHKYRISPHGVASVAGTDSMEKLIDALRFVVRCHDSLTPSDIQRMQAILAEVTGDKQ